MSVKFDVMDLGKARLLDPEQMGYQDSLEIIKDESLKLQKSFVKIGWYLKHIRDRELYKEEGYANINECAADQLGYSQSTTSRLINICERFSKNGNTPELDEKYAGFDKSQMIEMLPMEEEQLEKVTPDMSVAEIRAVKNEKRSISTPDEPEEPDIPGQMNIEEDFPEYLPETDNSPVSDTGPEEYAMSQKNVEVVMHDDERVSDRECKEETEILESEYDFCSETTKPQVLCKNEIAVTSQDSALTESEEEVQTGIEQPELPILKNDEQRKEWLKNYKAWGLWYRDENIDVNYYKFDFEDGSRLVVSEYPQRRSYWSDTWLDERFYHLLEKSKHGYGGGNTYDETYRHKEDCETYIIGFLKILQKK